MAHGGHERTGEVLTRVRISDADIRAFAATFPFVRASSGNLGIGVAAGAHKMGVNARIHLAGEHVLDDAPESNMCRLDCRDPSIVAWIALESCDLKYETLFEEEGDAAASAPAVMGIATTPSGAPGYGALYKRSLEHPSDQRSLALIIISEGSA